ncbi:MAG: hypothetical protein Q8O19_04075 [Rectinemataceae bacterium]|nr:hypothetical protein [Rectinemataceae bacterium]
MEARSSIAGGGVTDQQMEGLDRLSLLAANLPEDRKQTFENEVLKMTKEGMKTLILRIPEDKHKALKVFAASAGKNMTEIILEWIDERCGKTAPDEDDQP